jgi:hypothetical protein
MSDFAEPIQPEAEPTAATQKDSLREHFARHGFDIADIPDEDLAATVADAVKTSRELKAERERLQAELEQYRQLATQAKPPEAEQPKKEERKGWQSLEIPAELMSLVVQDKDTGLYKPKQGYGGAGIQAAEQINSVLRERERRAELFISNPKQALFQEVGLEEELESRIEKRLQEREKKLQEEQERIKKEQQAAQQKAVVEEFRDKHKQELFVVDDKGNPKVDPISGYYLLTELGKSFYNRFDEELNDGVPQVRAMKNAYDFATLKRQAENPQQPSKRDQWSQGARQAAAASSNTKPQPIGSDEEDLSGLSFVEMLERLPENAEILGSRYKGR